MKNLQIKSNPEVENVMNRYPEFITEKLMNLRRIIIEAARESDGIETMEETLKWGEPSYLVKNGSTVRVDWKEKSPDQYAIYFKCTSKLVSTFRQVFPEVFKFEGDRAIVFKMDEHVPEPELKKCISAALNYHKVKHLPGLGIA